MQGHNIQYVPGSSFSYARLIGHLFSINNFFYCFDIIVSCKYSHDIMIIMLNVQLE